MGRTSVFWRKGWFFLLAILLMFPAYFLLSTARNVDHAFVSVPEVLSSDTGNVYLLELKKDPLGKGKNKVIFPESVKVKTAKDLLLAIPAADAVSYFDNETNETVGYVSAFGGIGKNFAIVPGKEYEISVRRDARWSVQAG